MKGMKEGGKEGKKEERRHRQAGAAGPYVGEERKRGFKCPSSLMSAPIKWDFFFAETTSPSPDFRPRRRTRCKVWTHTAFGT